MDGRLSQVVPSDPDGHCHLHRATVSGPQDGGHGAHQVCMGLEMDGWMVDDGWMDGWMDASAKGYPQTLAATVTSTG